MSILAVIFMLIVLILLALPFLPIRLPFTFFWFNFPENKRPKNLIYIGSTLLVILVTVVLMPYILKLAAWVRQLGVVVWLLSLVPNHALYSADIFEAFFANLFFCVVVLAVHWITGMLFGLYPKFSLKNLRKAHDEKKAAAKRLKRKHKTPKRQPRMLKRRKLQRVKRILKSRRSCLRSCILPRSRRILRAVCWCKAPAARPL